MIRMGGEISEILSVKMISCPDFEKSVGVLMVWF